MFVKNNKMTSLFIQQFLRSQYRPWVALTRINRLVPKKTVTMANLSRKTAFLKFWPNFHGQYIPKYRSKPDKSYRFGISIYFLVKCIQKVPVCETSKKYVFFSKKIFWAKNQNFLKINTFLYSFYSEFYADSESVTFIMFTSIYWEILFRESLAKISKNAVFWAKFAMVTVFFGTNRMILVKAT